MRVQLDHNEVLEACQEYLWTHHGIQVDVETMKMGGSNVNGSYEVLYGFVKCEEAKGTPGQGPYRSPG